MSEWISKNANVCVCVQTNGGPLPQIQQTQASTDEIRDTDGASCKITSKQGGED